MNRRKFLSSSAMAAAGISMLPGLANCSSDRKMINLAIIGAGTQGRVLLNNCLKLEGISFRAVCDIWSFSQKYAANTLKKYGHEVNVYEDYREMLDKERKLDAVIVATPDFFHAEHAIACMEAGLDVYCEKEMAHNLEAAGKMVAAQKKTGRLLQIGHQRRSNPVYQLSLKMLEEDEIAGRINNCSAQWNKPVQDLLTSPERYMIPDAILEKYGYGSMKEFRNWRWFRKYSGGPVSDNGSHQIDIFTWFLRSNPTSVFAAGGDDYYKGREWYEDVMSIFEYPYERNGEKSTVRASYQVLNTNGYGGFFERYYGDRGTLTLSEFNSVCSFSPEPATRLPEWAASIEPIQSGNKLEYPLLPLLAARSDENSQMIQQCENTTTYMWHLDNFFSAVAKKAPGMLTCPAGEAYKTAVAVFHVTPSIESRSIAKIDPDEFFV